MTDIDYEQVCKDFREAEQAISAHQWVLGDLALLLCPILGHGIKSGATRIIKKLIEDTGSEYSVATIQDFRYTSDRYPKKKRNPNTSWNQHSKFRHLDNRFELVKIKMTKKEQSEVLNNRCEWVKVPTNPYFLAKWSAGLMQTAVHRSFEHPIAKSQVADVLEWKDEANEAFDFVVEMAGTKGVPA